MTARTPKFEIFQDGAGEWRWRLRGRNGEVMAQSEGYTRRAGAKQGCVAVQKGAGMAVIVMADDKPVRIIL